MPAGLAQPARLERVGGGWQRARRGRQRHVSMLSGPAAVASAWKATGGAGLVALNCCTVTFTLLIPSGAPCTYKPQIAAVAAGRVVPLFRFTRRFQPSCQTQLMALTCEMNRQHALFHQAGHQTKQRVLLGATALRHTAGTDAQASTGPRARRHHLPGACGIVSCHTEGLGEAARGWGSSPQPSHCTGGLLAFGGSPPSGAPLHVSETSFQLRLSGPAGASATTAAPGLLAFACLPLAQAAAAPCMGSLDHPRSPSPGCHCDPAALPCPKQRPGSSSFAGGGHRPSVWQPARSASSR